MTTHRGVTTEKSPGRHRIRSRFIRTIFRIVLVSVVLAAFLSLLAVPIGSEPFRSRFELSGLNGVHGFVLDGNLYGTVEKGVGSVSTVGDVNAYGVVDPLQLTAGQFEWQISTPESQGMSSTKLKDLKNSLASRHTKTFLVIRNDSIVYEWYTTGFSQTTKHYTASMAKALVSGVSLAVAFSDGRLTVEDLALHFVPAWIGRPDKSQITIRHLGTHTSGMDDAEENDLPHSQLTGWKGDFWKNLSPPNDPFTLSRDKTPVLFPPGTRAFYSNPGNAMLGYAITSSLKAAPQKDLRTLLRDRIMRPIGAADTEWTVGYGKTFLVDGLRLVPSWGGASYTPRAAARVARLLLRRGDWEGNRLINPDAVDSVTQHQGGEASGLGWWTNTNGKYGSKLPPDAYLAVGAGHQVVLVVPSLNLIVVRNGGELASSTVFTEPIVRYLIDPLMDTFLDIPPVNVEHGLKGEYFDNKDLSSLKVMRIDPQVNFNWGLKSPDPLVASDTFSVRWTGQVEARFSEVYKFYTFTDDGVRLWINGQLIINKWIDQKKENSGSIALVAGQRYSIEMEFYENTTGAIAQLSWSSPSQPKQIIPQGQLYSSSSATSLASGSTPAFSW